MWHTIFKNVAIIAHVDHGKTSLVDQLLTASWTMQNAEWSQLIMDSNDQEKERWITIYAKNTSIQRNDTVINIIDTPWHADFGSEVERVIRMVDSVLLVVDAYEGPMPQTKFVLKKALEHNLHPIVVINKIDKPTARPDRVEDQLFDLFIQLWANDEQTDFPVIYTSARDWYAFLDLNDLEKAQASPSMEPLLQFINNKVPDAPYHPERPFRMQIVNLDYDNFVWRLWIWRIADGTVHTAQEVTVYKQDGTTKKAKITKIYRTVWLSRVEVQTGQCGDIVIIAWIPDIYVGDTIGEEGTEPYPHISIDEPTLMMDFLVNTSPLAGKEGKYVTSRKIIERLEKELETNVGMNIQVHDGGNRCTVAGRWELHLSVLIETMRREWFELQVSSPQVIFKNINGSKHEPIEKVSISVADDLSGTIIDLLAKRKWLMQNMQSENGITNLEFDVPTRWLLWCRADFILITKGEWIFSSSFSHYAPYLGDIPKRVNWSMVSWMNGKVMKFSIWKLQERWTIFVQPAQTIYEWLVVWESAKPWDLVVNLTKNKNQSNMRTGKNDANMILAPIRTLSLEDALSYIWPDEYVEITPENIRIRKIHLKESDRKLAAKK